MLAVFDPNVIISALLSSKGSPVSLIQAWMNGDFELMTSPLLLAELQRVFTYPKLRSRIKAEEVDRLIGWLQRFAVGVQDPQESAAWSSPDPKDDYLLALAWKEKAILVSGDHHLLGLQAGQPIMSPAAFLSFLTDQG
ncbi:MAG: putative toxin-antitoxin system toxin component, PIN family [Candidatus Dormibacteraceae bacterium]